MVKLNQTRIARRLIGFFQQGTSPKGLALSTTVGVMLGIFPVLGVTTWVATIIGVRYKLNVPLMLTLLYLVWPIQVALLIPFLRLGEWVYHVPPFVLSLKEIQTAFEADFLVAIKNLWDANLCAAGGWLIVAIPAGLLLYFLLKKIFQRTFRKREARLMEVG